MADPTGQSTPKLDLSTTLAFDRTLVAYERTMLSWVRTATSLITFGFSIYKFFQIEQGGGAPQNRLIGSREFALAMVMYRSRISSAGHVGIPAQYAATASAVSW